MKAKKIVIVGGVASGPAAAAEARRTDENATITLIEKGPDISYSACEMPLLISGEVEDDSRLVRHSPQAFSEKYGVEVLTHHEVESIDPERRKVSVRDFSTQNLNELPYDTLVVATGSAATIPEALTTQSKDVHLIRSLEDSRSMVTTLNSKTVHHAVIVGAGYVGLDIVESLLRRDIRVTMLASEGRILSNSLDAGISKEVVRHLESQGVNVRAERATRLDVAPDGALRAVETDAGEKIGCSLALIATGTRLQNSIGTAAGLKIGPGGGYQVDDQLRTSIPNIWACGDCIDREDVVTGQSILAPLALNAFRTGRVAGRNAARSGKGRPASVRPVVKVAAVSVCGLEIAHTGWSEEEGRKKGLNTTSVTIRHRSASSLSPHKALLVHLVAEPGTRRILGAQIVGEEGAAQRVNLITAMIRSGGTVDDLYELDFLYAPRLAPAHDALMIAARTMQKNLG